MASIDIRVNQVLFRWCGMNPADIDQGMTLEDLWNSTRNNPLSPHDGIDFQPDGVQDLLTRLNQEFEGAGAVRKQTSVFTLDSFKPNGDIETVNDLISGVIGCPNMDIVPGLGK